MENQDKIFNQIKTAAEKAETKDFPNMENVWSRVEGKLDKKVLKKENSLWKKIAIAASILLAVSIVYQFIKSEPKAIFPYNSTVQIDSEKIIKPAIIEPQNAVVETKIDNPNIKKEASKILEKQITSQNQIVAEENVLTKRKPITDTIIANKIGSYSSAPVISSNTWRGKEKFESRGVTYNDVKKADNDKELNDENRKDFKNPSLVVIDDKVSKKEISNINNDDIESIVELKEPLYIINGVNYSENDLYGSNPTSPYAPLNKQKIETISVLQPEKAVTIYGEKGKKGVVIITTLDGKPVNKKKN